MNVHYSKDFPHAFVISPDGLKKLVTLLQNRVGTVDIRADCADDLSREFKTLNDLITYENPKSKEILSIHLRARSDDYSKSATIVFRMPTWNSSKISIDADGREDVVSRLREEILDIVAGTRPWYNTIPHILVKASKFLFMILVSLYGLLVFLHMAVMLKWLSVPETQKDTIYFLVSLRYVVLIFQVIPVAIIIFQNKLFNFFFPPAVFTIGQGKSRFKHQEKVRRSVIIGFGVSLAASLVVSIVMGIF